MKHTTIRVPDDAHRELAALAELNMRSVNAEIVLAIRAWVARHHLAKEASR